MTPNEERAMNDKIAEAVSVEDAIRLLHENAWERRSDEVTCGHTGCEDHRAPGRRMIHTYGAFGCDLDVGSVEQMIREAASIRWVDHLLRHDLAVIAPDGRALCLDIPRPRPAAVSPIAHGGRAS
jgi:hypothetical protein